MDRQRAKAVLGPVPFIVFFVLTEVYIASGWSILFLVLTIISVLPATVYPLTYTVNKRKLEAAKYKAVVVRAICSHDEAEPVIVADDEIVSWVCPRCDLSLPADWIPPAAQIEQAEALVAEAKPILAELVTPELPSFPAPPPPPPAAVPEGHWKCGRCESVIPAGYWHQCDDQKTHTAPYGHGSY